MIGVGIIGYGYWGPNLSRCVADADGCFVAAICNSSPAALAKSGKRHPAARLETDWKKVIRDPSVTAVTWFAPLADMAVGDLNVSSVSRSLIRHTRRAKAPCSMISPQNLDNRTKRPARVGHPRRSSNREL